ncbi:MAG TPA: NAD-dependent epimerase/dehydratase family protein [Chloroflexota bacterium]|nr:NAD-dependent epimerase/dehydratase family protein [Chloroflexota bacterium]
MRMLVTGGAGFIASHVVDLLIAAGNDVAVVDNFATGKRSNLNVRADFYEADLVSPSIEYVLATVRPEIVFHHAAQMSVKASTADPLHDARVNVLGLVNLLQACTATGVRKLVFASSGATYGNPVYLPMDEDHPQLPASPYGITKLMSEHYLRYYALERGLAFTVLRYGNVYGPRQDSHGEAGVIAIFARQLLLGQAPTIHWDGEQVRDYVYVADVARANFLAATAGDGRCYCIGTGVGTSVNRLYQLLSDTLGVAIPPRRAPRCPGDLRTAYFDSSRARRELGWEPTVKLREGLHETLSAYRREFTREPIGTAAY